MNDKNINNNETSYDKDDILREIERELQKSRELKSDSSNEPIKQRVKKTETPSKNKKVNKIVNNKNDLVKGILLSEILGKPKGRR